MKTLYYFIFLNIYALFLAGCCMSHQKLATLALTEEQKKAVYYTGNETLTFQNSKQEIITFEGKGRKLHIVRQDNTAKEACDYYEVEQDYTSFVPNSTFYTLSFLIAQAEYPLGSQEPFLRIRFEKKDILEGNADFYIVNPDNFCVDRSSIYECLDSLFIDGKVYTHVLRIENDNYTYNGTTDIPKVIFYQKEKGVLRFVLDNGNVYTLK